MKKWLVEDHEFTISVLSVGPDNNPIGHCRIGFEVGDEHTAMVGVLGMRLASRRGNAACEAAV